ncbi:MAG TPA: MFS transporter [Stellaceae bacterium]|nr:MFS transporter [Stellaceae bacterium]
MSSQASADTRAGVNPGFYKWVIVAMGWSAMVCTFVDRLTWGSVALQASHSLSLPLIALGVFVTAFFSGYTVANILGGFILDRIGARSMVAISLVILGGLTFSFSLTTSLAMGIVIQALMGMAAGVDTSASVKLVTAWFGMYGRGKAIGFLLTSTPCSVMITNAIVPRLLQAYGWQTVYEILGVTTALFGVICFLLIRNGPVIERGHFITREELRNLVTNRRFVLMILAGFGGYWAYWGFAFLVNAMMVKQYGLSPVIAGSIVFWFGFTSLFSKPIVGIVSDMLGKRQAVMIVVMAAYGLMVLSFAFLSGRMALTLGAAAMGFFSIAWSPLLNANAAEACGKHQAGTSVGIANGLWQFSSVVSPSAAWVVYQSTHSFAIPFIFLACGPLVSTIALFWVRDLKPQEDEMALPERRRA